MQGRSSQKQYLDCRHTGIRSTVARETKLEAYERGKSVALERQGATVLGRPQRMLKACSVAHMCGWGGGAWRSLTAAPPIADCNLLFAMSG